MHFARFLSENEFESNLKAARIVVAHAGMGIIFKCIEMGKPFIVVPRRHVLGEHRSDHQIDTCKFLEDIKLPTVAWNTEDISSALEHVGRTNKRYVLNDALVGFLSDYLSAL